MFDTEAAEELLTDSKGKPPLSHRSSGGDSRHEVKDSKQEAKDAALAARSASRILQGLPSKAGLLEFCLLPSSKSIELLCGIAFAVLEG